MEEMFEGTDPDVDVTSDWVPRRDAAEQSSIGGSLHAVVSALLAAEKIYWNDAATLVPIPGNTGQEYLITLLSRLVADARLLEQDDSRLFESIASQKADDLITFLFQKGFNIPIDPLGEREVGFASVLNALVKWKRPGEPVYIQLRSGREGRIMKRRPDYPGVRLTVESGIRFYYDGLFKCVQIETQNGDLAHLMMTDVPPENSWELLTLAEQCVNVTRGNRETTIYSEVHFPMIDLSYEADMEWMFGLGVEAPEGTLPGDFSFAIAKEHARLRINCEGAHAESAFVGVVTESCRPTTAYIINRPFLFVLTRPGLNLPYFAAWCNTHSWRDPKSLG